MIAWLTPATNGQAAFWATKTLLCCAAAAVLLSAGIVFALRRHLRQEVAERWRERRMREELEAYARLDTGLGLTAAAAPAPMDAARAMAKRVARTIAEKSAFTRVGVLLRDAEGRLYCAGTVAIDDLTAKALEAWGQKVVEEERGLAPTGTLATQRSGAVRVGLKSFSIPLGEWARFDREVSTRAVEGKRERRKFRRAIVAPVRMQTGRMMGAIAVCADGSKQGWPTGLERAMGPIEALAGRIAASLENEALTERLLRAEKLAGLGQLAGGVAHALNNPLTAVLGFAELIAETATESRVRKDASTIAGEALKMRDTVQRLLEFWRPVTLTDEPVELAAILHELSAQCRDKLHDRGVQLIVTAAPELPPIRGSRDRLRQVMEHLLNNSAQAIAAAEERRQRQQVHLTAATPVPGEDPAEPHAIRVTVSHDDRALHVIVSDTGPGFREPGRIFDPFYTTNAPEAGAGMGLSICYGIVREHGGEISAFNLHPRGAAVVVELPVRKIVHQEPENVVLIRPRAAS